MPVNDNCLDCGQAVNPQQDRQEIAFDDDGHCRRRCGTCIEQRKKVTTASPPPSGLVVA